MYGYVVPDVKELNAWDYLVLTGHYCGHCICIKRMFGNMARFTTNHDFAYFSAFLHELMGIEPRFDGTRCISSPFREKSYVTATPLMERIVSANIIYTFYKVLDSKQDEKKAKGKMLGAMLKKAYKKSAKLEPEIDKLLEVQYKVQRELELSACADPEKACMPTATILRETMRILSGNTAPQQALELFHNLGKFIYFADAIDDLEKDRKSGSFNVVLNALGFKKGKKQFLKLHKEELMPLLDKPRLEIERLFRGLSKEQQSTLSENILVFGLAKTQNKLLQIEE